MKKYILSIMLCICVIATNLPMVAQAIVKQRTVRLDLIATPEAPNNDLQGWGWDSETKFLTCLP